MLESGGVAGILPSVVGGLELGWWEMADGLQEPAVVEPVDPRQGGVLDLIKTLPGATPADQLGLVQADDRLGQRIVERVATRADRAGRAGVGQPLGVADRQLVAGPDRSDAPGRPAEPAGASWPSPGRPGPGRCGATARPASPPGSD